MVNVTLNSMIYAKLATVRPSTYYDCMIYNNNKRSNIPLFLFLSSLVIGRESYRNCTSIRHVGI